MAKTFPIVIILLACINASCASSIEELEYSQIRKELGHFLAGLDRVKISSKQIGPGPEANYKDTKIVLNYDKKIEYIQKTEGRWGKIRDSLEQYINSKSNEWVDDAKLCLGMLYASISLPGNLYTNEALKAYENIIEEEDRLKIDKSTIDIFENNYISVIFQPTPDENWTKDLDVDVRIIKYFRRYIVSELLKAGSYEEAIKELDKFNKDQNVNRGNLSYMEKEVNEWLKRATD